MARSLSSIRMDFTKALRQASQLEDISRTMRRLGNEKLEGTLQNLGQNWTGDNSLRYIGKGRQLEGKIIGTSNALMDIARTIRQIAQNVYEAEMRAWEIAHNRDH